MKNLVIASGVVLGISIAVAFILLQGIPKSDAQTTGPAQTEYDVKLGHNASLGRRPLFPPDNAWNIDVSKMPVDEKSDMYINVIGADKPLHPVFGTVWQGQPHGIPYVVVPGDQPRQSVKFTWVDQSDGGYYPIPDNPPIEPGDGHCLIVDRDNWVLYELYALRWENNQWNAHAGAIYDLNSNDLRPHGWTSADAAGLPVLPGLVRYDEVVEFKEIPHALRFTTKPTRRAYLWPARHFASKDKDESLPPMGLRVRLKADYDISGYPESCQVILTALKKYGMILADNGGPWFLTGAPDPRWNNADLLKLMGVKGEDFEVVQMGGMMTK